MAHVLRELVVRALRGAGVALERAGSVCVYLAVGVMRRETLERHIRGDWQHFGIQQSEHEIASGLFPWERDFYAPFLRPGDRILVVGCGSGRDLIALRQMGHQVAGLDPVAECVALTRERLAARGLDATLYTGRIETLTLPQRFDVFIFSWFCYGYIPQRRTRMDILRKAKEHLLPGGRILITYIPRDPPPRRLPVRLARLAARLTGSDWRPEDGDLVYARHDVPFVHFEHRFLPGEIETEARDAGLRVAFHDAAGDGNLVLTA